MCALLLFGISSHAALAATGPGAQFFETGRLAFEAGNYAEALAAFEAALQARLQGPAIHFNIGVAAYRLGRYARAETAFLEVARTPAMAALAHYNLGLVALRRADTRAAASWFELAEREAQDERLRALASTQLAELPALPQRNWAAYAAFNAGYDDNVALVADSDVLGTSGTDDTFLEGQLAFSAPLDRSWRLDAGLVLLDYQQLDAFDQTTAQGGARYLSSRGRWDNEIAAQVAYSLLDGKGFEQRRVLSLQTGTELAPHWRVRGRYRCNDSDGLHDFTGVGGRRHEVNARLDWERAAWNIVADYRWDRSDLNDPSLSATRNEIGIGLQRELAQSWTAGLQLARRHSSYRSTGGGTEDRTALEFMVTRTLNETWSVSGRYAYADNDAELPQFNYTRSRIYLGIEAIL